MDYTRGIDNKKHNIFQLKLEITKALGAFDDFSYDGDTTVTFTYDTALTATEEDTLYLLIDTHLHTMISKFVGYKLENTLTDDWASLDIVKPYEYEIQRGRYFDSTNFTAGEDKACFLASPDTTVGAITADVTAGDTKISVSSTVIPNIKVGYLI